jgi:hypothetical protein
MEPNPTPPALLFLLVAQMACTTVYAPPGEPLTETSLADAIQTLRETGERVEILEDGLRVEVYIYEWRRLPPPPTLPPREVFLSDSLFPESRWARMLTGPPRSVYLPYESIRAVEARSWPLWSGVELEVAEAREADLAGPLVIRAHDAEEAARLTDAIDRLRRARLPAVGEPRSGTEPAD